VTRQIAVNKNPADPALAVPGCCKGPTYKYV
jgi:hypothetical protein